MPRDAGLTRLRRTVVAIAKQFDAAAIGYMVIGGIAQVVWGEPRATTDDVAELLKRRRDTLDRDYLDPRVHELAVLLDRPDIDERYLAAFA